MKKEKFIYDAYVIDVHDGDSITVDIDLGFNIIMKNQKLRLYGLDAPELIKTTKEAGIISRDWLRNKILNKNIVINTIKDKTEKYGRWLAILYLDDINLNELMIKEGLAI